MQVKLQVERFWLRRMRQEPMLTAMVQTTDLAGYETRRAVSLSLHHTGLTVSDLRVSLRFWRDALGLEVVLEQETRAAYLSAVVDEHGASARVVQLEVTRGGPRIELYQYLFPRGGRHAARPADVGFAHVCLRCDRLDRVVRELKQAGGEAVGELVTIEAGANRGGRAIYVRDPDGHVLELFELPAESTGMTPPG
jgi:lactoylglutathione lyase